MMNRWPSPGFVVSLFVLGGCLSFLGWGIGTPELDRVWTLQQELWSGRRSRLDPDQRAFLQASLWRHPSLADALLGGQPIGLISAHRGGWLRQPAAVLVRTPASTGRRVLHLRLDAAAGAFPLEVTVVGADWRRTAQAQRPGELDLGLPEPPRRPELITLEVRSVPAVQIAGQPGVWLGFPGGA